MKNLSESLYPSNKALISYLECWKQSNFSLLDYWKEAKYVYSLAKKEKNFIKKEALVEEFKNKTDKIKKIIRTQK